MFKSNKFYITVVMLVVFIALYLLVSIFAFSDTTKEPIENVNLIKLAPTLVYGSPVQDQEEFTFKLNDQGEAALIFNTNSLNLMDFSNLQISLQGLSKNSQVLLIWTLSDETKRYESRLRQADGSLQNNAIYKNKNWRGHSNVIGLNIIPQEHLGISASFNNTLILKSAQLSQYNGFSNLTTLMNCWLDYQPWNYRSINHLRLNEDIPLVAQPIVFALLWLLLCIVFLFFLKKKPSVIYLLLSVWLFLNALFILNDYKKLSWADEVYQTEEITHPDENLYKLAMQIKSLLNLKNNTISNNKSNKVLVLSSNRYERSRMIYHLLPINSSFLDANIEKNKRAIVDLGDYILSYDNAGKLLRPIDGILTVNELTIHVEEIAHQQQFSIMKVLEK